jgi:cobyrinic acid a,c-diamide synthase
MPRVLVIAGAASGVGKTTITLGLLAAYRRRGLAVQAFKVGPDFIDPGFHELVTGRPSYNLDGWMCGRDRVIACVAEQSAGADLVIVEGVMGCFDGIDGTSEDGSTAQVAKWLGAPVVLVVDASAASRSVAAVVLGFERFDPALDVAAVIFNRAGGDVHARWLHDAVKSTGRAVPLGAIRRDEGLTLPERHLGLVTAREGTLTPERQQRVADAVAASIDLDQLLTIAKPLSSLAIARPRSSAGLAGASSGGRQDKSEVPLRVAVARDAAFQFYYPENLDLLRASGAEIVFWSPVSDPELPDVDGLYFGGGYPELHARALAENTTIVKAVRDFAEAGKPIYAECGGLMFLAETLEDADGIAHAMVGVLPTTVRMRPRRLMLGYTEVTFTTDTPLGPAGTIVRGHEFHYSTLDSIPDAIPQAYRLCQRRGAERREGYLVGSTLMSYVHLHFASNPAVARGFIEACARSRA